MRVLIITLLGCLLFFIGCVNDMDDVKALFDETDYKQEVAKDVKIYYSDSAQVRVIINAPTLRRFNENSVITDEFPDGVLVEFLDENQGVTSWLESDYAIKTSRNSEVTVRENVQFYNSANDKLETSELVWNEDTGEVYTDKFVKISQPSRRDTSYGFGFKTDEKFTRFEIEKFQAVKSAEALDKAVR